MTHSRLIVQSLVSVGFDVARSYRDAPEIDGYVLIEGELPVGELVPVRVTGAMVYDLIAMPTLVPQQVIKMINA